MKTLEKIIRKDGEGSLWLWCDHLLSELTTQTLLFDTRGIANQDEFPEFVNNVVLVCSIKALQTGVVPLADEETARKIGSRSPKP